MSLLSVCADTVFLDRPFLDRVAAIDVIDGPIGLEAYPEGDPVLAMERVRAIFDTA